MEFLTLVTVVHLFHWLETVSPKTASETWCNRPEYTPAGLYPGLKRPRLDYIRVYYGLGQFLPLGILWPRPIHTHSGQIIP